MNLRSGSIIFKLCSHQDLNFKGREIFIIIMQKGYMYIIKHPNKYERLVIGKAYNISII